MSHNMLMFVVLYGASMIPWILAFFMAEKEARRGLFLMDLALSIAAYTFLWWAIGWWIVPVSIGFSGLGYILKAVGLDGYDVETLWNDKPSTHKASFKRV